MFNPPTNSSLDAKVQVYDTKAAHEINTKANTLFRAAAEELGLPTDVEVLCLDNQLTANKDKLEFTIERKLKEDIRLKIDEHMPLSAMAVGKGSDRGSFIKSWNGRLLLIWSYFQGSIVFQPGQRWNRCVSVNLR
ncbi:hypothetical protein GYMLUDRAFT_615040 [Collybiopsis luxurians FD-317 M1]|uniref:Uncharacterized protein n=1 Tax=Collybiopsis luxurians FD-317 M1 TaxID=944289 RepID=A0A0D0CCH5_9AGAR|nr:hypothetical protein GYMLUDRAFT_615040 [Collybiopsis luxurians FD-317 M1]